MTRATHQAGSRIQAARDALPQATVCNDGFTLVETLVSVALIATVVSMVYASYFATVRSMQAQMETAQLSYQGRQLLAAMARQLRCAYVPREPSYGVSVSGNSPSGTQPEAPVVIFRAEPPGSGGPFLSFLTTHRIVHRHSYQTGLFRVYYRYVPATASVLIAQENFVPYSSFSEPPHRFRPVATDVAGLAISLFDGRQWHDRWDYDHFRRLPSAARITIWYRDHSARMHRYQLTTEISCAHPKPVASTDTLSAETSKP